MSEHPTPAPGSPQRRRRLQLKVREIVIFVFCCAAFFWAWRSFQDAQPTNSQLKALRSDKAEDRQVAAQALGYANPDSSESVIPALVAALEDQSPEVRLQAAQSLGFIVCAANKGGIGVERLANDALLRALKDPQPFVRAIALRSVAAISKTTPPTSAPPALLGVLTEDDSAKVRAEAAAALSNYPVNPERTIAALFKVCENDVPLVRDQANDTLAVFLPTEASVPLLISELKSRSRDTRYRAVEMLGRLGTVAESAVPALAKILTEPVDDEMKKSRLHDSLWDPAWVAARSLGYIAPRTKAADEAIQALTVAMQTANDARRDEMARVLGDFGPAASGTVPLLISILRSGKTKELPCLLGGAAYSLGILTPGTDAAHEAVVAMKEALEHEIAEHRPTLSLSIIDALAQFGTSAKDAIPVLQSINAVRHRSAHSKAIETIKAIETGRKPVLKTPVPPMVGDPIGRILFSTNPSPASQKGRALSQ